MASMLSFIWQWHTVRHQPPEHLQPHVQHCLRHTCPDSRTPSLNTIHTVDCSKAFTNAQEEPTDFGADHLPLMRSPCAQSGNAKRPWRSVASECLLDAEGRRAMGHPDPGRQPGRYARSLDEPKNTTTPPLTRPRSDFIRLGRTAPRPQKRYFYSVVGRVRSPGTPIAVPSSPIFICMSPMDVAARTPQPLAFDSLVGSTSGRRSLTAPCRECQWPPAGGDSTIAEFFVGFVPVFPKMSAGQFGKSTVIIRPSMVLARLARLATGWCTCASRWPQLVIGPARAYVDTLCAGITT